MIALAIGLVAGGAGDGYAQGAEDDASPLTGVPELREPQDPIEAIFQDWETYEYRSGTLSMRSAGGSMWSVGNGPARLELRLDGWSQDVLEDPFCENAGLAGCQDDAGARMALQASFDIARNLELRFHVGASGASNSMAADAGASIVWWFSDHVGLVLGFGYLLPLPVGASQSAVPAMLDFEQAFTHESPYDLPDNTNRGNGNWFGGFGLITRD